MISYPADDSEGLYSVPYNLLLRFFFLLVGACVIAESAVLDIDAPDNEVSEFWGSIKEYMTSAKVSMEWIPWFLAWGQGVMLSANIKWYKPERYCMGIYRFCERISYLMRSPSGY